MKQKGLFRDFYSQSFISPTSREHASLASYVALYFPLLSSASDPAPAPVAAAALAVGVAIFVADIAPVRSKLPILSPRFMRRLVLGEFTFTSTRGLNAFDPLGDIAA
eukprot:GFYU01023189.1.p1 GENE.GFYU01023189.1~~GFYU01023189.1.p1  ORF type:complete len:107 (+),score=9.47 GFYU01023189.1:51-371(+)